MSEEAKSESPADIEQEIQDFLSGRLKTAVPRDQDLFESGLVTSMFAMELVVHLEAAHGVSIIGGDLRLDNFRTVERMTQLVTRLRTPVKVSDG
ncbi:acyl carrier protein [Streptomyces sp. NBC_01506]|uniref:acyl carrier protein n=1 Tax=Streptomyces sp. NBC_01506 TaxID=2903887 RepID=UPI00386ADE87